MLISKSNIENNIPQRAPFIMVDNLIEATMDRFKTDFQVLPENIFIENGVRSEFALIENIAQSSAAGLAFIKKNAEAKIPGGFIGGISKLVLYDLPKVSDIINTSVRIIVQFENMILLKGKNCLNGKMLLECEIKLVGN
jgi:predicted hotdog family 3-hydroxylacyl-ACP dehydratase